MEKNPKNLPVNTSRGSFFIQEKELFPPQKLNFLQLWDSSSSFFFAPSSKNQRGRRLIGSQSLAVFESSRLIYYILPLPMLSFRKVKILLYVVILSLFTINLFLIIILTITVVCFCYHWYYCFHYQISSLSLLSLSSWFHYSMILSVLLSIGSMTLFHKPGFSLKKGEFLPF